MTTNTNTAKSALRTNWDNLVASGDMSAEEMAESLQDQVSGYTDLSADELTDEMANILGWDIANISDEQLAAWRDIVDTAAKEWLADHTAKAAQKADVHSTKYEVFYQATTTDKNGVAHTSPATHGTVEDLTKWFRDLRRALGTTNVDAKAIRRALADTGVYEQDVVLKFQWVDRIDVHHFIRVVG